MFDFEKLDVYNKACEAHHKVYRMIKKDKTIVPYVKYQLGRASLNTMLNIAEGSARFNKRSKKSSYIKARSFVFQCTSLLSFLHEEGDISNEIKEELYASYESISKMLFTMINHLAGRFEWKEL